jgi:hypothetical protein
MMRSGVAALVAVVGVVGAVGAARANVAAVRRSPAVLTSPRTATRTPLAVRDERLAISCREGEARPTCTFEARYAVTNPTAATESVVAAFYGVATSGVTIVVDGARADRALTTDEAAALDVVWPGALRGDLRYSSPRGPRAERTGFALTAAAGSAHTIVVTGTIEPVERSIPGGYVVEAAEARHLALGSKARRRGYDLDYLVSPIETWAGEPTIHLRVEIPAGWRLGGSGYGWAPRALGERAVFERSLGARGRDSVLHLDFDLPMPVFRNGGVLLGAGGALGDRGGFRARLGYEVAAPAWMLYALVVDSDLSSSAVIAPMARVASPLLLIVPSFSIGAGLPIQVRGGSRVGVRIEADAHLASVGFVTTVDVFPGTGGYTQVTLMGQIGL